MSTELPTPKVFVSYAWTDEEHKKWVVEFASRLMGDGVEVILDVWDLKEGHDKYKFMERMVSDKTVTKVLAICDKKYALKADDRAGGVGTESQIISPKVYEEADQEKFIPIIRERDEGGMEYVPVFFKGKKYFDFSDEDEVEQSYEALVRNLFGKPELVKPALGKPPAHLLAASAPSVRPAAKLDRLKNAIERGRPHGQAMLQEYFDVFLEGMESFRVPNETKDVPFDDAIVKSATDFIPWRDNLLDAIGFAAGYMNEPATIDRTTAFLEQLAAYANPKNRLGAQYDVGQDNYRLILYELFLSTVAVLLKGRHFGFARALIDHEYNVATAVDSSETRLEGIRAFNDDMRSLDGIRNERLKLNAACVAATMIKQRATYPKAHFKDLLEVDALLFVRLFFGPQSSARFWNPRLSVYLESSNGLPLFVKATSESGLAVLKQLLPVQDRAGLTKAYKGMIESKMWADFTSRRWGICMEEVLNVERIIKAGTSA